METSLKKLVISRFHKFYQIVEQVFMSVDKLKYVNPNRLCDYRSHIVDESVFVFYNHVLFKCKIFLTCYSFECKVVSTVIP